MRIFIDSLTRRELIRLSLAGAAGCGAKIAWPALEAAAETPPARHPAPQRGEKALYAETLKTWCDGMVAHQVTDVADPALHGGLLCPACALIHGRCADAVYPLLCVAHMTNDEKYLRAALDVYAWSEGTVSREDGSWVNDASLSSWQGITVFRTVALAESLEHHGSILDPRTRTEWTARLARAAKFLDQFITIETGAINYPITSTLAFVLCGRILDDNRYVERGRGLARQLLGQFTAGGFIFGEGHPLQLVSPKGCRPVDLGYNVEESLPSLALYSLMSGDEAMQKQVVTALKTHMEFMLPDGAWDNSWGTRNFKWSWWGSRTSDGCQPGFVLMAEHDPRFREAARRNLELMALCTHNGLLYGGPDYFVHGDQPCIHHTFAHAKSLAMVLDRGQFDDKPDERPALPRDEPYGLRTFPEIGTRLASIGPWRATVTEYDWQYLQHTQGGGDEARGGHVSGGALSLLFHRKLGPICVASMTEYQMLEISNQQQYRNNAHMELTPRIESSGGEIRTSLNDYLASVSVTQSTGEIAFAVKGRLLSNAHQPVPGADVVYQMTYRLTDTFVELRAKAILQDGEMPPLRLIVPVLSRKDEHVEQPDRRRVLVAKAEGVLAVSTDSPDGFLPVPNDRTFNLVPGFEALPLAVTLESGREVAFRLEYA